MTWEIGVSAGYSYAKLGADGDLEGYLKTVDDVSRLGFRIYAPEILAVSKVDLFTPPRRQQWRVAAERVGITFSDFNCFAAGVEIASLDPARQQRGREIVKLAVESARDLGIKMISTASAWPEELIQSYRPEYFNAPPDKSAWRKDLSWENYWRRYCDDVKRCFEMVKNAGMTLAFEARANTVVGNLDAFLRLHDELGGDEDFGCELDVMHILFVNEDLATTIRRAGSTLKLLQVCDADGLTMEHRPLGTGKADFRSMLAALDDINYTGILQLELYGKTVDDRLDDLHVQARTILMELQR